MLLLLCFFLSSSTCSYMLLNCHALKFSIYPIPVEKATILFLGDYSYAHIAHSEICNLLLFKYQSVSIEIKLFIHLILQYLHG